MPPTGRFAPSPTGPLHLGSLVAAVGSWMFARHARGRWLVRLEDLDTPRVVAGAADEILAALQRFGLRWDGEVAVQSRRLALYEAALAKLRRSDRVFDCACSRADLRRAASAPTAADGGTIYPGTCRHGLPEGRPPRAVRFRVPEEPIQLSDRVLGALTDDLWRSTGDFVVRRADGPFAYQLAVVVDDAEQGVTEVVRGRDLLSSTARQIALQRALGLPTPTYAHLPLLCNADGRKLGKRDGALPLPVLRPDEVQRTLQRALAILGAEVPPAGPERMLAEALERWSPDAVPNDGQPILV